jgi:mono/diheme cytochrome c family protein
MTINKICASLISAGVLLGASAAAGTAHAAAITEDVSYALDVQPILESRCVSCHRPGGQGYIESGLDMSTYAGLMRGTKYGPIVIPGEPLTSNLSVLIEGRADPRIRMPHGQRALLRAQTEIIRAWIRQGALDN